MWQDAARGAVVGGRCPELHCAWEKRFCTPVLGRQSVGHGVGGVEVGGAEALDNRHRDTLHQSEVSIMT